MVVTDEAVPAWKEAGAAWGHAPIDWAYGFEHYARDAIEDLFSTLGVGPGVRLVDVACGAGLAVARGERLGADVAGIDAAEALIEIARRRAPAADLRAGDMFALPWDADSFDVATSINGIWGGCADAVTEIARVLRPGGAIGITFWGSGDRLDLRDYFIALGRSTPEVGEEMLELANIATPGVAEAMLTEAGFVDLRRTEVSSVLEFESSDDAWRVLRSPGVVEPALRAHGDRELRRRVMPAVDAFAASDGSIRLVNEQVMVTGRLSG